MDEKVWWKNLITKERNLNGRCLIEVGSKKGRIKIENQRNKEKSKCYLRNYESTQRIVSWASIGGSWWY